MRSRFLDSLHLIRIRLVGTKWDLNLIIIGDYKTSKQNANPHGFHIWHEWHHMK